ncbi:hypothetical protein BDV41DRAFT_577016 [Aspergillus transmontanensis]|uniref:Nephrocystin 3-like N-terminal domain-containing protein n=1 Tax=Aspergillus transmontanensis TaxID=1034304 RepID=A0A5N6VWX3_9EURO|nr:hypothetical protein BDV41DRAFT_577016 [Aspergillus transmontanensis]
MQKRATRYQPRVFFSGGGVESQRTPLGSLRSLLNQLFRQDEVVRPLVRDEYREKCHAFGGSGHGWHWQLEQLLQDSIVLSAQQQQVTIFVDELDGVGAKFALEIAAYFHQARHWLQHLPHELSDFHQDIQQNVLKREYRSQSHLLFQWLCYAGRLLSVTKMRFVLAAIDAAHKPHSIRCHETSDFIQTDERMKQWIRALSGGLIEVVKVSEGGGKETVKVIRQSVTEFLRAQGLAYLATLDEEDKKAICVMPDTEPQGNDNIHNCPVPFDGSCLNHLVTEYAKIVVIAIFVAMMFSGFPTSPFFKQGIPEKQLRSHSIDNSVIIQTCQRET